MTAEREALTETLAALRDLIAGTTEVLPYEHGETVYLYCGKACRNVAHTVMVRPNSNMTEDLPPSKQYAMCSTYGCMSMPKPPVRYRVTQRRLEQEAALMLPGLPAALAAHVEAAEAEAVALDALIRVAALGDSWVGFDSTHHFGDALLNAIGPTALRAAAQERDTRRQVTP